MIKSKLIIDGKLVIPKKIIKIFDLNNKKNIIGELGFSTKNEIDKALDASTKYFNHVFKYTSVKQRTDLLFAIKKCLLDNQESIATLLTQEIAKPYNDSLKEVIRSAEYVDDTVKIYKELIDNPLIFKEKELQIKNKNAYYTLEPLGPILCIIPFNYPINLMLAKVIPALISGNTVIIKSSTRGSLVTSFFLELLNKVIDFKPAICFLTLEGSKLGDYLIRKENIKMISFTGSTSVGKKIASLRQPMVPIVLEMGGKDAAIVLEDCDLKTTAKEIVNGAFNFNGQRCTAIKRVIVDVKIANNLIKHINELISQLVVGDPFDSNVNITSLISKKAYDFIIKLIDDAKTKKAKFYQPFKTRNHIIYPMLISDVKPNMLIWSQEQFGPILPLVTFKNTKELIKLANDSNYGLQSSIFSTNIKKARELASYIECATININKASSRGPDVLPFSGIKDSGFGIQGIKYSILSMTYLKGIVENY